MCAYRRVFDKTKFMSFLIKDEQLLEKNNEIWRKVSNIIKKEFDSKSVSNENYLKTEIKSYDGEINTNFHNKVPSAGSHYICLSVISIDLVCRKDKNYRKF